MRPLASGNSDQLAIALRGTVDPRKLGAIEQQADTLRKADVIILNQVDLGMKRTDYRHPTSATGCEACSRSQPSPFLPVLPCKHFPSR
jgi:hypothetical protein